MGQSRRTLGGIISADVSNISQSIYSQNWGFSRNITELKDSQAMFDYDFPHLAGGEKLPLEDQSSKGPSPKSALAKLGHLPPRRATCIGPSSYSGSGCNPQKFGFNMAIWPSRYP